MKRFQVDVEYSEEDFESGQMNIAVFNLTGEVKNYSIPMKYSSFVQLTGINPPKKSVTFYDSKASSFLKKEFIKNAIGSKKESGSSLKRYVPFFGKW